MTLRRAPSRVLARCARSRGASFQTQWKMLRPGRRVTVTSGDLYSVRGRLISREKVATSRIAARPPAALPGRGALASAGARGHATLVPRGRGGRGPGRRTGQRGARPARTGQAGRLGAGRPGEDGPPRLGGDRPSLPEPCPPRGRPLVVTRGRSVEPRHCCWGVWGSTKQRPAPPLLPLQRRPIGGCLFPWVPVLSPPPPLRLGPEAPDTSHASVSPF